MNLAADAMRSKKLKWLCRRGMKELDTLLERFIDAHESQLAGGAWPEFELLLQFEDDRLWRWLQNPGQHDAARFRPLLDKIRHGAAGAH